MGLRLQHAAGNATVARLLQSRASAPAPTVQRCGPDRPCDCPQEAREATPTAQTIREAAPTCTLEADPSGDEAQTIDDVVATAVKPCYDGGAVSVCNPGTGNYDITSNGNNCASRSCSQRHEERHVSDLGPCCRKLKNAIAAGGDRNALVGQYNTWMETAGAHAWSECNAYGVSISCVDGLLASNNCASQSSQACDELTDYKTDMTAQQTSWCGRSPGSLPPCPF